MRTLVISDLDLGMRYERDVLRCPAPLAVLLEALADVQRLVLLVRIRQWRPSDRDLLVSGFYRLSPNSSYRRFLSSSPVLTGQMMDALTYVDHRDHEAMIALDEQGREGL